MLEEREGHDELDETVSRARRRYLYFDHGCNPLVMLDLPESRLAIAFQQLLIGDCRKADVGQICWQTRRKWRQHNGEI
jgi:hypothetical protein